MPIYKEKGGYGLRGQLWRQRAMTMDQPVESAIKDGICTIISSSAPSNHPHPIERVARSSILNPIQERSNKFPRDFWKPCFGCGVNEQYVESTSFSFGISSVVPIVFAPILAAAAWWLCTLMDYFRATITCIIFSSLIFLCNIIIREIKRRLKSTKVFENDKSTFEDEEDNLLSKVKYLVGQQQYQNELAMMLSRAIQIPTISYDTVEELKNENNSTVMTNGEASDNPLIRMHELLRELFPLLHQKYPPVIIHKYSLLFIIPGKSDDKLPIMLCAHMDVVPAPINENVDSEKWMHEPFSGEIADGFIWGRGGAFKATTAIFYDSLMALSSEGAHNVTPLSLILLLSFFLFAPGITNLSCIRYKQLIIRTI